MFTSILHSFNLNLSEWTTEQSNLTSDSQAKGNNAIRHCRELWNSTQTAWEPNDPSTFIALFGLSDKVEGSFGMVVGVRVQLHLHSFHIPFTMGRYYSGDISGKFWFGIQSSHDADYFGVKGYYDKTLYWSHCGGECDTDVQDNAICPCCDAEDECIASSDFMKRSNLTYDYEYEHIFIVEQQMDKLVEEIKSVLVSKHALDAWEVVSKYREFKQDEEPNLHEMCSLESSEINCIQNVLNVLLARYDLGFQIWRCLNYTRECYFRAEC
jgi:hypothetical protein